MALHRPGQAGIATRLALCFGLGYAAAALTGVVLEILHVLNVVTYVGLLAAVTALLWGYAIRRDGLRAHVAALRDELVAEPWLTGSGLAAMLLFALMRLRFSPLLNFSMFGPWRYWQDGIEIADAGRVPHQTLQWGATYTPTVSKVILNSYQAGMSYLIGASPLPAMGALLWLVAVGLACGLWALGRELGLRYTAALLAAACAGAGRQRAAPRPGRVHRREHRPDGGGVRADAGRARAAPAQRLGRAAWSRACCSRSLPAATASPRSC